jgi:uncharacterized protein (TIGR02246 family)
MKKHFLNLLILFLLTAAGAFGQDGDSDARAEDEKAIRANVEQLVKGWNMKSGEEFAKPFAEDSDYIVINGRHIKGRAANARGHQQIFDTIYKDSDIDAEVEQIRFVRPDVAVVHLLGEMFSKADRKQGGKSRLMMVMVKTEGKWEIVAYQNTRIQTQNH